jgi:Cu(I)/Ag(I) efflux system periplasmic protein CusF
MIDKLRLVLAALMVCGAAIAADTDTDGEVKKIDKSQSKITIKHGEIKNLDMPAMTMVFRIKDSQQLDGVAVGDKIKFTAEKIDGTYVVTQIVKAP